MKDQKMIRIVIIILAVVAIALLAFYAGQKLNSDDDTGRSSSDGSSYYSDGNNNSQNNFGDYASVTSDSDGGYTVTDDSTVEMDSIPNDADTDILSGTDAN